MAKPIPCPHAESLSHCPPCYNRHKANKQREYRLKIIRIPKEIRTICTHGVYRTRCISCGKEYRRERYIVLWCKRGRPKVPFPYFQPILELI